MVVGYHYFVLVACDCAGDIWKKIAEADRKLCLAQAPISAMYNGISYTCICKLMAFLSRRRIRTLRQNFLAAQGLDAEVIECVVEMVQAEADQLPLMLDGGAPWQTVRADNKLFKILHSDAAKSQAFFRALSMIPALLLPPRWFYAGRRWLGKQTWYRDMRQSALPVPRVAAVRTIEETKI
jgi:hypothetical protein